MKRGIRVISVLFLLLVINSSYSQSKIFLDIKTPFLEKNKLFAVKAGTIYFIHESKNFEVREVGEDYSIWLLNYSSKEKHGRVIIEYDVEVRSPAMIRRGRLLKKEHVSVMYRLSDPIAGADVVDFESLKEKLKEKGAEIAYEAYYCGKETFFVIRRLLSNL